MNPNLVSIGAELAFTLTGATLIFAARWPYSADAVRMDAIAKLNEAQETLKASLKAADKGDMQAHYRILGELALLQGRIKEMLKDVRNVREK